MGHQPSKIEAEGVAGGSSGEASPLLQHGCSLSSIDDVASSSGQDLIRSTVKEQGGHPNLESPPELDDLTCDGDSIEPTKSEDAVRDAACLVRDGVLGDVAFDDPSEGSYRVASTSADGSAPLVRDRVAIWCRNALMFSPIANLPFVVGTILVLLTFLEPPKWCRNLPGGCEAVMGQGGVPFGASTKDDDPEPEIWVQYYPNTKSTLLHIDESRTIEGICLLVLLLWTVLRVGRDGSNLFIYLREGPARMNRMVQIGGMATLFVGLLVQATVHHPYLRAILVISFLPNVQRDLKVLWHMLPQTGNILSLLLILMVFYAWLGTIVFEGTNEGRMHFSSLVDSMWTLYLCVTTANYPDVMMPAYNANRWSALYFVSFMVMSFFYFLNVILAAIVQEYEAAVEKRKSDQRERTAELLGKAFLLLRSPQTGGINRSTIMELLDSLCDDMGDATLQERLRSPEQRELVFVLLDQDGSENITSDGFSKLGLVLQLELIHSSAYQTAVERYLPGLQQSPYVQRVQNAIRSPRFDTIVDGILVMNALVIAIKSFPELSGQYLPGETSSLMSDQHRNGAIDTTWEVVETLFTMLYVVECLLKVTVFGSRAYFEHGKNVFDFSITVIAVVCSILVYVPSEMNDSRVIRMVVTARVLRLLRVLTSRKRFQLIGAISAEILPQATSVLLILFFLLYMFAVVGTHLFGGMITRDPNNPFAPLVMGTDFSANDYWGNNFNDMLSAMNVLFNLLVINNWTACETGFEAVTQGKWVRWFFISFHVLGVILVNNLVIAFVISDFMQEFAHLKEVQQSEATLVVDNAVIDVSKRQVYFDASQVTGTKTNLTGRYIARYRRSGTSGFRDIEDRDTDRLRQLFSQT